MVGDSALVVWNWRVERRGPRQPRVGVQRVREDREEFSVEDWRVDRSASASASRHRRTKRGRVWNYGSDFVCGPHGVAEARH